jgi:hypothetical protein
VKRIHLLRALGEAKEFAPLLEAMSRQGARIGWLILGDVEVPPDLETAARSGAAYAVAAGPVRTVSVKHRQGPAVTEDLLREHFLGCIAVLVQGDLEVPTLAPPTGKAGWVVTTVGGQERQYAIGDLLAAFRRPRPFTA